jgi:hypothetical protein
MNKNVVNGLSVACLICVLGFLGSCASVKNALNSGHETIKSTLEGTARVYPVDESQAWKIAKAVFRWEGAEAIQEDKDKKTISAKMALNMESQSAQVGVWVEPVDSNNTKITVVVIPGPYGTSFRSSSLSAETYHKRFAQAVAIVKEGRTLPYNKPY